jgi:hypothetical protein
VATDLLPCLWLKTGPVDTLLEHWVVRQRASQISGDGSEPTPAPPSR